MSTGRAARRAAVVGSPITHSLSPVLHRAGYAAAGLTDFSYERIECDADGLPGLVADLDRSWAGLSVTMPGKAAAAALADVRSTRVEQLGVANTLVRATSGGWLAENTDVDGVLGALRAAGIPQVGDVLVLGGGGTAAAAVLALAERSAGARPCRLVFAGRRPDSTSAVEDLARRLGMPARRIEFTPEAVGAVSGSVDLVVSTVPVGGADHLAPVVAPVPVLFDVIYHPWPTTLAAAGDPRRVTVTGLDMLLHQALRQFELMTGLPAPAAAMRDALRAAGGTVLPLPL